MVAKIIEDL